MERSSSQQEKFPPFKKQNIQPPGIEEEMDPAPHYMNETYKGSDKLKGKISLITGGDSGIGRSVALHFAREGADVAFTYLPVEQEDADQTRKAIENENQTALALETDLTTEGAAESLVEKVVKKFGRIDILVNNAAFQRHRDHIDELSFEQFRHSFEVNVFAYFKMVKAALPYMKEGSCILNTSSILGYIGNDSLIDYSATKGAIHNLTKSLAKELADRKIRVNSVAPGPVWTPLNPAERKYEEMREFGKTTVFGRPAQPEEIAPAYVFLASEITGGYITGETVNIFGKITGAN